MAVSLFDVLQPLLVQHLRNLLGYLEKAQQHLDNTGLQAQHVLEARLAADMFSFRRQVQIATDHAKGAMARLSGSELPRYADDETSLLALQQRVEKTLAFVQSFAREQFDEAEERNIHMVYPWATYDFTGLHFLNYWAIPNFLFHVTTAYAILRHLGVPLGKADFLGASQ